MPSIPFACNLCKEEVKVNTIHINPAFIIWCDSCVIKQSKILDQADIRYEIGISGYNVWGKPDNIAKLFDIMNRKFPTEKVEPEPEIITNAVCKHVYYGINCNCSTCEVRIQQEIKKYGVINPFGY